MIYIVLTLATVALILAFVCWRRFNKLQIELVKSRNMVFDMNRGVREIRDELKQTRQQLQLVMRHSGHNFRFEKNTLVEEALIMHPGVRDVLASLHLSGDANSAINDDHTLEEVAVGHQKDVNLLLNTLNSLLDQGINAKPVQETDGSDLLSIGMMPDVESD